MASTRRELLKALGLGLFARATAACGPGGTAPADASTDVTSDGADASTDVTAQEAGTDAGVDVPAVTPTAGPFKHGVASGDPLPDAVILWTRVTVEGADREGQIAVRFTIAEDTQLRRVVGTGIQFTNADQDFTVKVDVHGLAPGRTYYYAFEALEARSPVGRTRTAPVGAVERLRFAVASCASYAHGYFHAYEHIARQADLDAVIFLGDYIYEYASDIYGSVRAYDPPTETLTLADYRRRYAHYRSDPALREAHRQHPFICVWDDHEFADNAWAGGAGNHQAGEGAWAARMATASQAYLEWLPVRVPREGRIFRALAYGDLLDLVLLDTRVFGREEQLAFDNPRVAEQARTLLGAEQERWLDERLAAHTARWCLLGQQVMVAPMPLLANNDQWDGYPAARHRLAQSLREHHVNGLVVLTGDIHTSWAVELQEGAAGAEPQRYGVEFVAPAVTSPGLGRGLAHVAAQVMAETPAVKYADVYRRGWLLVDVTPARVQGSWVLFDTVETPTAPTPMTRGVLSVAHGTHRLQLDERSAPAPTNAPPLAP